MILYDDLVTKYEENSEFIRELSDAGIDILNGYRSNKNNIKKFYKYFYKNKYPKIVLCGINPGRNGAGKTGIPFIDFDTLREIFLTIFGQSDIVSEKENSAQFIKYLIEHFEGNYTDFFEKIYLTNYSFLGYTKGNDNLNYFELPPNAKGFIDEMFVYEMNVIKPNVIIPLSEEVEKSLILIKQKGLINFATDSRLPHPRYCFFPSRIKIKSDEYLARLNNYLIEK